MSDFDKEAERERLQEKYERDEQKREVTERMSELLLKGATMTNAHCLDCGDPIFRYDGQEFCPTCEKAVDRGQGDETERDEAEDGEGTAANGDSEEIHVAKPSDETRVQFGDAADQEAEDASGSPDPDAEGPEPSEQPARTTTEGRQPDRPAPGAEPGASGDLAAAHAALSRTVTRLARQAEAADDLGQKRDLLAAAHEAAEALSAVREAGR